MTELNLGLLMTVFEPGTSLSPAPDFPKDLEMQLNPPGRIHNHKRNFKRVQKLFFSRQEFPPVEC